MGSFEVAIIWPENLIYILDNIPKNPDPSLE